MGEQKQYHVGIGRVLDERGIANLRWILGEGHGDTDVYVDEDLERVTVFRNCASTWIPPEFSEAHPEPKYRWPRNGCKTQ